MLLMLVMLMIIIVIDCFEGLFGLKVSLPRDQNVLDLVADAISEWNEREENAGNR
jgi:hypothetical protein